MTACDAEQFRLNEIPFILPHLLYTKVIALNTFTFGIVKDGGALVSCTF